MVTSAIIDYNFNNTLMPQKLIITNKNHITSVTQVFMSCLTKDDLASIDKYLVDISCD